MYVMVQHRVKDPEFFFADIPGIARKAPSGVEARQFCPSEDRTTAVCLWEAESVEAVRQYLEEVTGDASENSYFQVSEAHAMGLPGTEAAGQAGR